MRSLAEGFLSGFGHFFCMLYYMSLFYIKSILGVCTDIRNLLFLEKENNAFTASKTT